jgi:hypothetical protein
MAIDAYVVTGTGRCGTQMLAEVLSLSTNSRCRHEHSFTYACLVQTFHGDEACGDRDLRERLLPTLADDRREQRIFGECSGLAYLALERLWREFDERGRYVLMVRHPATFVPSAVARGFFDPEHPHPLEHLRPRPSDPLAARWRELQPAERCLWYWHTVNAHVLGVFGRMPPWMTRVVRMEDTDAAQIAQLYEFLGLQGYDHDAVSALLARRINATPGQDDEGATQSVNPWSVASRALPAGWERDYPDAWTAWAEPLLPILYPHGPPRRHRRVP